MALPWYEERTYHVGELNYAPEVVAAFSFPAGNRVKIVDSTIRKLESTPGVRLSIQDKVDIALMSKALGVAEIYINNIHFVPDYFVSAREIAIRKEHLVLNIQTWLTESWEEGVSRAIEAGADCCEVEARTSNVELQRLRLTKAGMMQRMKDAIKYGMDKDANMTAGFMDCTRAELGFLIDMINQSLENGVSKLTFYDSFGALSPDAMRYFIKRIRTEMIRETPIVMHVHNSFGLATAGSLAAVTAGATHVDCAAYGLPSNIPLAPLEETVLALELLYKVDTGINLDRLYEYCKLVERMSGVPIAPYKPIIGDHIFLFESDNEVAEHFRGGKFENLKPYAPELVGKRARAVWGINTLRGEAIRAKMTALGLPFTEKHVAAVAGSIKEKLRRLTSYPFWVSDEEVEGICRGVVGDIP